MVVNLTVELEEETDGRWIAEVPELPGVMAYGDDPSEAYRHVYSLAFMVLADKIEHNELPPVLKGCDLELRIARAP